MNSVVTIIGLSPNALCTALLLADKNITVQCFSPYYDESDVISRFDALSEKLNINKSLNYSDDGCFLKIYKDIKPAGVYLIYPADLILHEDKLANEELLRTASLLAEVLKKGDLIILDSELTVGATEEFARQLSAERDDLTFPQDKQEHADVKIACSSRAVVYTEISANSDCCDRIIGVMSSTSGRQAESVYRLFSNDNIIITDCRTAEMYRQTVNSFREVTAAFANDLYELCDRTGVNISELASMVNRNDDVRIPDTAMTLSGTGLDFDSWFPSAETSLKGRLVKTALEINSETTLPFSPKKRKQKSTTLSGKPYSGITNPESAAVLRRGESMQISSVIENEYIYSLHIQVEDKFSGNSKGIVASYSFYDCEGESLAPDFGYSSSARFPWFNYISTADVDKGELAYDINIPVNCARLELEITAFNCAEFIEIVKADIVKYRMRYDDAYVENLLAKAAALPVSNGSAYYRKLPFKAAVIGDIFMFNYYKDVFEEIYYLSPSNFEEVLGKKPDFVLYTTCWRGIEGEEWRWIMSGNAASKAIDSIIEYSKLHNIKLIFQSIEDPVHFDLFLPLAKKFDCILTSDADIIDKYVEECGHNNVFYGEYGVNPAIHNPIGCRNEIIDGAFFAGSYYRKYPGRCADMKSVLDSVIDSGGNLIIADRNFKQNRVNFVFPVEHRSYTIRAIEHVLLQNVHKLFRYNLNFSTVKQSSTMCAMRVYELQAMGTGFISNYSISVFNKFPNIRIVSKKEDLSFDFAYDNCLEEYRSNMRNVRTVFCGKTSFDLTALMLKNAGLTDSCENTSAVCVLHFCESDSIKEHFCNQRYSNKILVSASLYTEKCEWDKFFEENNIRFFTWFRDGQKYEKDYLTDMINAFKYTGCSYVTKNSYFEDGKYFKDTEHDYTDKINGTAKTVFLANTFSPADFNENDLSRVIVHSGGYSTDPFELNYLDYAERNKKQPLSPVLSVIIPVYNNGKFLVTKCIPSLKRNKIWDRMEILLVDDGSTDCYTPDVCREVCAMYPNVKLFENEKGGSGSASRPRNQGIEMASCDLITFLDPDNEISAGGYDSLVNIYNEINPVNPIGFVSGYYVIMMNGRESTGALHASDKTEIVDDFYERFFRKMFFPVISTQSCVIKKSVLTENNVKFIEKAVGQDTFFGWELLCVSGCGVFTNTAYLKYYADRSDSVTNTINRSFFDKSLIMETAQVEMLEKYGLLEYYKKGHFDNFFNKWYLKKLESVKDEDYDYGAAILRKISALYKKQQCIPDRLTDI